MRDLGGDRRYRPDIDGLRCTAVLAVLLAHSGVPWFRGGYVGVDVFFVISGFLITRILWHDLDNSSASLLHFYERRARRILPALALMTTATLAAGCATLGPQRLVEVAQSAVASALLVSNVFFLRVVRDYFGTDILLQPLLHTWSLAVEEQFYLLFPLVLALIARAGRRRALPLIALICFVSFALAEHAIATGRQQAAFFLLHLRAWEIGVGTILAIACPRSPTNRTVIEALALLAAAAILLPLIVYDGTTPFPGHAALPPVLGAAALIWLNAGGRSAVGRALSWRPAVFVGRISYSVYLWHWPIMVFDRVMAGSPTTIRALICVALSLLVGAASWRWIERPFRDPAISLQGHQRVLSATGAMTALAVGVAGMIWFSDGLPGRISPEAMRAFAARSDIHPLRKQCRTVATLGAAHCRIGAPVASEAPADFLLWGDSHAEALAAAIEVAGLQAGKNGFVTVLTGCAPLLHVDRINEGPPRRCSDYAAAVVDFLRHRDDMPVVILSARWGLSADGARSDEPSRRFVLASRSHGLPSGHSHDNLAIFREGISDTLSAIRATGRRTVILGSVPELGWSVPDSLGQSILLHRPAPDPPNAASIAARTARSDAVLRALVASGVTFVPLVPVLCTPVCAVTDPAGRPAYIDDDHMSRSGAVGLLAGLLRDAIWGKRMRTAAR